MTNVGEGHVEGFGSLDGVMREKLSLVRDVPLAVVGATPGTSRSGRGRSRGG